MLATSIKKFGGAAAVAALTLVGWAGSAQALQVVGRWDPVYGSPFPITGQSGAMWWSGRGDFTIADSCVVAGTGVTAKACGIGGQMFVDNVTIDLSLVQGGNPFATLTFSGKADIFVASFENGKLKSVLSDYFDPWAAPNILTTNEFNVLDFTFNLAFNEFGALLYHADNDGSFKHFHGHDDSEHFWNGKGLGHLARSCTTNLKVDKKTGITTITDSDACGYANEYAKVQFDPIAAIPEPQTYALMLLGLVAIGFSARLRS